MSAQDANKSEGKYLTGMFESGDEKTKQQKKIHVGNPKTSDYSSLGWLSTDLYPFKERRELERNTLSPPSMARMHELPAGKVCNPLPSQLGVSLLEGLHYERYLPS